MTDTAVSTPTAKPLPAPIDDATRQAQLTRMKRWAGALLVVALLIFLGASWAERFYWWAGYIRATAEAALIGGLADWFAVTALFRHPLGIPIPHTAIIPTRKDRLGRTLGNFVQNHFLSREVLTARLRVAQPAQRLAEWLVRPDNGGHVARQLTAGIAKTVEALPEEPIRELLREGIVGRLRSTPVAPLLGNVLALVRSGHKHQDLLSEAVRLAARAVDDNREKIRDKVKAQSPWWIPGSVDDKIYQKIVATVEIMLDEVALNQEHPLRAKFDTAIERFVDKLKTSPETIARAEALKEQLLNDPVMDEFIAWLVGYLRSLATGQSTPSDPTAPSPVAKGLAAFGQSLLSNPAVLEEVNEMLIEQTVAIVEQYRTEVSDLISQTVQAWDPMTTSRRIELAIGKDLQFIRINGTLVGGLLGLVIYALTR